MGGKGWEIHNPEGANRVLVTRRLPGTRWLEILGKAGCRVEVGTFDVAPGAEEIREAMGEPCHGVVGQLTEPWGAGLFEALHRAGGRVYSNYAVGYDNVDLEAATRFGIPVGNTPGVLTETTAEMAVALTFAAARRVVEGDRFMREGRFHGWMPSLFLGDLLWRRTVGVIGAGRIGSAYARMMVEGHKMNLIYYSPHAKDELERCVSSYGRFLASLGEPPVTCRRAESVEEVLEKADVVSLHAALTTSTRHLINRERLGRMKEGAILVNTGRGPLIDEEALVEHCRTHPSFKAALDVFEDEPVMKPGLEDLSNVVAVPHLGSATRWTREGMAILAARNVAGVVRGWPVWKGEDIAVFLGSSPPPAVPSLVNARELGLPVYAE